MHERTAEEWLVYETLNGPPGCIAGLVYARLLRVAAELKVEPALVLRAFAR